MNPKLDELEKKYGSILEAANIAKPYLEARLILERILGHEERIDSHKQDIESAFALRKNHVPVDRIFCTSEFCGLPLRISDDVFRPYPETEEVVTYALSCFPDKNKVTRILDLGTGTGCILFAVLNSLPQATGMGVDLDTKIILLAQENAEILGFLNRVEFRVGDWGDNLAEKFDLIISNPPRVATTDIPFLIPEMRDHDPVASVDGGPDGLNFYRRLAKDFDRLAIDGAFCVCQVGPRYAKDAESFFRKASFKDTRINLNQMGIPCCITIRKKLSFKLRWRELLKVVFCTRRTI